MLGKYLPKLKKNKFMGVRTTLTLSSDEIWSKTHKFAGKIFVIFGFTFAIVSLIIPGNKVIIILVVSLIIITIISCAYPKRLVNKKS